MARRKRAERRKVLPDSRYNSVLVTKFINSIMGAGKKSVAEKIFYTAMDLIQSKLNTDPFPVFEQAVNNVKPVVEVRSRRVGGATYQVPVEVRMNRKISLAIRWLLRSTRSRPEHSMAERLASEIIAANKKEGAAIKKREDTHKMAEANRAFAHFRW